MPENHPLSERELEILQLVATGASNKDIANELVISINTVKVHLRNIYSKLDVSSRTEATIFAVQTGLVPALAPPEEIPPETENLAPVVVDDSKSVPVWKRNPLLILLLTVGLVAVIFAAVFGLIWWPRQSQTPELPLTAQALEQDRWAVRAEMLAPRSHFATTVMDGDIYVFGGRTAQGLTTHIARYRVNADTWEYVADLPQAGADIQAVTIGGKIYIPGGSLESGALSRQLLIYDPGENHWQDAALLPVPVSEYALVAFEGKLYLFGGWDGTNYLNAVWRYDPSLDQWKTLSPMPTARGLAGAGVSGGEIHVVGGFDGEKVLGIHEVYTPDEDKADGNPWLSLAPLPEPRSRFQLVSVAETLHLIGGTNDAGNTSYSYKYLSQSDAWEKFLMPEQNFWVDFGAEIVGENIYIFGGQVDDQKSDQHYAYHAVYLIMIPVLP